jgi:hypothetical protein
MPRAVIAAQTPKGPYPGTVGANALDIAYTAATAADGQTTTWIGGNRMALLWRNSGVGARTVTITSAPSALHARSGDITAFSSGAGEYGMFIVERDGWQQSDGCLYYAGEHSEVLFAVVSIP